MPPVTVAYCRISQDREANNLALDRQRESVAAVAERHGATLSEVYAERASAAGKKRRPEFERLLAAIDRGEVGVVVSYSFDRLSRHPRDTLRLMEACRIHRVNLWFEADSDMDVSTAGGEFMASVRASVARSEIAMKSERQRAQRAQEAEQGRTPPTRRAFGYQDRQRVASERFPISPVDPDEAPLVVECYRQLLDGRTMGAIARWLREQGSTTPRGRPWTHHNLKAVLTNPRYKGIRGVRPLKAGMAGELGRREDYHQEIAPGNWEALVSAEMWDAAQTILRDPERRKNHPVNEHGARYLLPFLATCGTCNAHLITGSRSYPTTDGRVNDRLLRCSSLKHVSRKAEPIEAFVEAVIIARLSDPKARQALRRQTAPAVDLDALKARSVQLTSDLNDARKRVGRPAAEGGITLSDFSAFRAMWEPELAEVDAKLAEAFRQDPILEMAETVDPEAVWKSWPIDIKRRLVAARFDVVVHPGQPGRPGGRRFDPSTIDVSWR